MWIGGLGRDGTGSADLVHQELVDGRHVDRGDDDADGGTLVRICGGAGGEGAGAGGGSRREGEAERVSELMDEV